MAGFEWLKTLPSQSWIWTQDGGGLSPLPQEAGLQDKPGGSGEWRGLSTG